MRFRVFEMASSSAPLTAAESQQLQKLLAKAKSAALPSGSTVSFPRVEPTYDPATGLVCHHEFGLCENVWDAAELWDESEPEIYGTMSDAAKRREADERPPAEHHPKRVTMATGRTSTGESVMYAPTRVAMPYPSGTTEDQLPVHH